METDTTTTTAGPEIPPPAPEPASRWEDFLDIFYAPAAVFERRRDDPRFGLALLAVTILMVVLFYASQGTLEAAFSADFDRAMEADGNAGQMNAEQRAQAERMAGTFGTIAMAIGFPIGILAAAAVLWLVGKAVGSVATFAMAALVATYAQIPRLLQSVLSILQGMFLDGLDSAWRVSIGPARFFDPDTTSAAVMALLGRFDLFVLWSTVLLAIGLAVMGRISRGQAAVAAAVVWVLGVAPALIGAL